jgi:hypothetical protein
LEHCFQLFQMVFIFTIHTQVIIENFKESMQIFLKNNHHCSLEGFRSITQAKGHHPESICAPICGEGSLQLIFFSDRYVIVPSIAIQETK